MRRTAKAPSNIAFIKYWGKKDEELKLPENGSLSMNLSNLYTVTTVKFSPNYFEDCVEIDGVREPNESSRAIKHLDRVRLLAKIDLKAKVVTRNNFPVGTGLSSSASGFAALSLAASKAAGLNLSERELSILARQGSGSACRSIPDGFVEWLDGNTSGTSYSVSLHSPKFWYICDVVAVVSKDKKDISSTEGQKLVATSEFFSVRKAHMNEKLKLAKKLLSEKNFAEFGELIEAEALELHAIMLTSRPSLIYWTPGTLTIMKMTKKWRDDGIEVYFTINTGQDIHLICRQKTVVSLERKLAKMNGIKKVIVNQPSEGARIITKHLF
jgi:diphosphomevalonate decarboxylase